MSETPAVRLPDEAAMRHPEAMPATPIEMARLLWTLSQELERAHQCLRPLGEQYAKAKANYRVAYAKAYLTAKGAIKEREQAAILTTSQQFFEVDVLEQRLRAAREHVQVVETQIRVLQSMGALMRAEMSLAGMDS